MTKRIKEKTKTTMNNVFWTIIGVLLLVSCNQSSSNSNTPKNEDSTPPSQLAPKVRKPLSFSGTFYQITCLGSPDIVFTEGDYSIEAEAPENVFNAINVNVDSNVLTISIDYEESLGLNRFKDSSPVTLYVSCPSLQLLATCGTGNFKSIGTIHNEDMHVGCLGTGSIELDTVITTGTFKYESSDDGNAVFRHIRSTQDCKLLLSGAGNTTADVDVASQLIIQNDHTGNVSVSGKAKTADVTLLQNCNCVAAFDADQLNLSAIRGNVVLKGKYAHKDIYQGKHAKVSL
jgi:hypothetical protein